MVKGKWFMAVKLVKKAGAENAVMTTRRQRILQVAARRFAEAGFEPTTVRQIADDVAILSGSLYHHFATKEDMLHEIIREAVERLGRESLRIATLSQDAESRIKALIRAELNEMSANQQTHAILYNERKFFRRNADFSYVVKAKKDTYRAWEMILADGVREGVFAPDMDGFLTISTAIRMLNTGADWFVNEDGSPLDAVATVPLDRLCAFYTDFILRSIRV